MAKFILKRDNYIFLFTLSLIISIQAAFATEISKPLEIDIGLIDSSIRLYLSANKDYEVYSLKEDKEPDQTLMKKAKEAETLVRFGTETNDKLIIASAPDLASSSQDLLFTCSPKADCIWTIKENHFIKKPLRYRGSIIIKANAKDFTVINHLNIEDYLKGVVASEMPSSWHKEALKAQSVAARTYTVSKLNRRKTLGYDLKPTVEDQVYLGVNHERDSTNQAIKETANLILVDSQKKPIEAYFYSQAGFATASANEVWGLEHHNYLRPQLILDNTKFWQKNFSIFDLSQKLADLKLDSIQAITVLNRTPEGRVKDVLISGDDKHIKLTGEELRHKLGLRSTFFDIEFYSKPAQDSQVLSFVGKGFGHGIGMSQYGAKKLAEQGKGFKEILEFFYPGSQLTKIID